MKTTDLGSTIEDFIRRFVLPKRQSRYLTLISSKKGRQKFRQLLDHDLVDDLSRADLIPPSKQSINDIEKIFRELGVDDLCIVISSKLDLSEKEILFREALEQTIGYGFGTVLIFPESDIAYYEAEDRNARYILRAA